MFIAYSETCPVMYLRPFKRHRISWQSNHFGLHKWYELWFIFLFILVPLCVTMFYFLILGRYDLHLPNLLCRLCLAHWTPDMSDLISSGYWPASVNADTLFSVDVFSSFEEMKTVAPGLSRQGFLRMLERRTCLFGRVRSV